MAQGTNRPPAGEVYGSLLLLAAQQAVRLLEDAHARGGHSPAWAIQRVGDGIAAAQGVPEPWWREIVVVILGARDLWVGSPHYRAWLAVLREAEGRVELTTERKAKVG